MNERSGIIGNGCLEQIYVLSKLIDDQGVDINNGRSG